MCSTAAAYIVLGPAVGAADVGGRSLGRAPVGFLQVVEVLDLHALAHIETGKAPPGAHVAHAGHDAGLHRTEPGVRLLVTRFLGENGQAFALKLREVTIHELGSDGQTDDRVIVQYQHEAVEEASHERVRSLGLVGAPHACALLVASQAVHGEVDEALRIRREASSALKKLGDRRAFLLSQASMAAYHLTRNRPGDHEWARRLYTMALGAAEEMKLPEAEQFQIIMKQNGLRVGNCHRPACMSGQCEHE
jgi:HEAT repeat protein